jgi:hypothetical protein
VLHGDVVGSQHSDRLAGLVFVEALDDPADELGSDPEWMRLLQQLPAGFLESQGQSPSSPSPDYSSFRTYQAWQTKIRHYALPESELRQLFVANSDGTMGTPPYVAHEIADTPLRVPIGAGRVTAQH